MDLQKRRIACFCENTFEAELPRSADLTVEPQVAELILKGDFMAVQCPACGKRLTPEFPFRLHGNGWEVLMIPEEDRGTFERGKLEHPLGDATRVAVGFPELAEKVLIFGLGLDDRVIEIMKYYLLTGAAERAGDEDAEPALSYHGREAGRHVFHVSGLRKGEVAVARMGPEVYDRIARDIEQRVRQEPFNEFCAPPWVSLRKVSR